MTLFAIAQKVTELPFGRFPVIRGEPKQILAMSTGLGLSNFLTCGPPLQIKARQLLWEPGYFLLHIGNPTNDFVIINIEEAYLNRIFCHLLKTQQITSLNQSSSLNKF